MAAPRASDWSKNKEGPGAGAPPLDPPLRCPSSWRFKRVTKMRGILLWCLLNGEGGEGGLCIYMEVNELTVTNVM